MAAPQPSARGAACDKFHVMEVVAAAAAREASGGDVVHMEVGQPGGRPPEAVLRAAREALDDPSETIGYTPGPGRARLLRAIAAHYASEYGVDLDADEVVAVTGSSAAFALSFLAAFDAGDIVYTAAPGYPCYVNILKTLGVDVRALPVGSDTNFQLTPHVLDAAVSACSDDAERARVRGVVVASPSNPTGTVLDADELRALCEWASARGAWLVSDEIYHGITYGDVKCHTAREFSDSAIVINSFSKLYCMTGWRLGWMLVPKALRAAVGALQCNMFINAPTLSQRAAGEAAFECAAELRERVKGYERNRAALLEALPECGFPELSSAQGAFYLYARVEHLLRPGTGVSTSVELCEELLRDAGVACAPGIDFDKSRGHLFVRFSYCGEYERVCEGISRLRAWYARRRAD